MTCKSSRRRVARTLSTLLLLAPAVTLSACAQRIQLTQAALPCGQLVDNSGLLKPTPAAALPANDQASRWVAFSDIQTGQLDRANGDKQAVHGILETCDSWQSRKPVIVQSVK